MLADRSDSEKPNKKVTFLACYCELERIWGVG